MLLLLSRISVFFRLSDEWFHGITLPGRGVHIVTELLNVLILLDFTFYFMVSRKRGLHDMSLPV